MAVGPRISFTITAPEQSDLTIAELSQEVSDELASLREFESYPIPDSEERRKILDVRRDEKTIAVLQSIMTLSDKVLKLPTYAPEYKTLVALMSQRGDLIERTLIERFTHLTQRLNVSCSGMSLAANRPYIRSPSSRRTSYT